VSGCRYFLLIYITLMVLLPIVPAIVTFKVLPSRAAAGGPFKGLRINLGGGFAAYFVVLLLLLGVFGAPNFCSPDQVWQVTGAVRLLDQEGVPFESVRLSPVPPPVRVRSDGTFTIKVLVPSSDGGGQVELPDLLFEAPGYLPWQESLDNSRRDIKNRTIKIANPIELKRQPAQPYRASIPLRPEGTSQ
jgi:hypothetical protein